MRNQKQSLKLKKIICQLLMKGEKNDKHTKKYQSLCTNNILFPPAKPNRIEVWKGPNLNIISLHNFLCTYGIRYSTQESSLLYVSHLADKSYLKVKRRALLKREHQVGVNWGVAEKSKI